MSGIRQFIPLIGAAVAVGVLAAVTGGISFGPSLILAADIGFGVGLLLESTVFKAKQVTSSTTPTFQFQFSASQLGGPIPIVFGTYRLSGNYLRFDPARVGISPIATTVKSGKGLFKSKSQSQVTGYIYNSAFELGLCMGPIDALGQVYTSPNAQIVRSLQNTVAGPGNISGTAGTNIITGSGSSFIDQVGQGGLVRVGTSDITGATVDTSIYPGYTVQKVIDDHTIQTYEVISTNFSAQPYTLTNSIVATTPYNGADCLNTTFQGTQNESGSVRVYAGNPGSNRVNDGFDAWGGESPVLNYRNICFAVFAPSYQIGQQPVAKTYQFEIQRMPKCYRDNGTINTNIIPNGSMSAGSICFQDANPAAILYEVLTNQIWGLRRSASELDVASFEQASQALANDNIGMSFCLDSVVSLSDLVDEIKKHCSATIYHNGQLIKCRYLYDRTGDSYEIAAQITRSSITNFKHGRKTWQTSANDLRFQFTNRLNAYTTEVYHLQDLGAIRASGIPRAAQINFTGFSNADVVQRMALRVLRETSYPQATASFTMNRWDSYLEPYDLISIYWDESWTPTPYTGYYRVISVEPKDDDVGGIEVTVMEDITYLSTAGTASLQQPAPTFQQAIIIPQTATNPNSASGGAKDASIVPAIAFELNCYLTQGGPSVGFAFQRYAPNITGIDVQWSDVGANLFTDLGSIPCFAITGTLAAYGITRAFDRQSRVVLTPTNYSLDHAQLLEASLVSSNSDSFETLLASGQSYMLVDQEIIQIGKITDNGDGTLTLKNIVRGCYGTAIASHAANAQVWYIPTFNPSAYALDVSGMENEAENATPVEFAAVGLIGGTPAKTPTYLFANPDRTVKFLGNRPFAPSLYAPASVVSGTPGSTDFTVAFSMRPRCILIGAGVDSFLVGLQRTGTPVDPTTEFRVQQFNSSGVQIGTGYEVLSNQAVFIDSDETTSATGLVAISGYSCNSACKTLKIYIAVNGWPCLIPLTVPLNV